MKGKKLSRRGFVGALTAAAGTPLAAKMTSWKDRTPEKKDGKVTGYRMLGRTGFRVSDIGLGGVELTTPALVTAALDAGINYIDTAEGYMRGQSEINIGKALKNHKRDSVFISTKLFFKPDVTKDEIKTRANKCLERLQTEYVDCLMIHGTPNLETLKAPGFHAAYQDLHKEGKVRFCGLSNHGSQYSEKNQEMENIMIAAANDGRFDVALFVYNFLYPTMGENILRVFQEKNIGATLMKVNPVLEHLELDEYVEQRKKDGRSIPEGLQKRLDLYKKRVQMAESFRRKNNITDYRQMRDAAIRFALSHRGVHSVTFSIKNFEQIESYAALSGTTLQTADKKRLSRYKRENGMFYCRHACGECESVCPQSVPVNTIMRYQHYFKAQGREKAAMQQYARLDSPNASVCETCSGMCEAACPHQVPIHGLLQYAHELLT